MSITYRTLFLLICILLTAGCTPTARPGAEGISIVIPIQADQFSKQAVLKVRLLNEAQLAIEAKNPNCVVTHDSATNTDSTQCPPGANYQNVTPEEFSFPIAEVGSQIKITSSTVKLGEKFQVSVSGMSADGCNTTSTSFGGTVNSETVQLYSQRWWMTMVGCITNPS